MHEYASVYTTHTARPPVTVLCTAIHVAQLPRADPLPNVPAPLDCVHGQPWPRNAPRSSFSAAAPTPPSAALPTDAASR